MIIYKVTNLLNGKFYIGKDTKNDPKYFGSGKIIKQAISKYGIENFKKETIETCESEEALNESEIFWIKEFNAIVDGYNITNGGEGGDTISNHPNKIEISKRHSDWAKKNSCWIGRKRTEEEIEKWRISIGDKMKGENNPNYGKEMTDETKCKIREKALGREVSDDTRKKISEKNKGKPNKNKGVPNPNHSKWMSENNPFLGKTHTDEVKILLSEINKGPKDEETKNKISKSLKEYYKSGQMPKNTKSIRIGETTYNGYREASDSLGIPISTIRNRIKSKSYIDYYHI